MGRPNCYRPTAKMKSLWLGLVLTLLLTCHGTNGFDIEDGGIITEDTYVDIYESPYLISKDLLVAKDVTLTIQEGVEMRFAPRVMLAVNGTLIARVSILQDRSEMKSTVVASSSGLNCPLTFFQHYISLVILNLSRTRFDTGYGRTCALCVTYITVCHVHVYTLYPVHVRSVSRISQCVTYI